MRLKQRTWFRRTIAAVLVAGMTVATGMFTLAAPGNGGKTAGASDWKET